MTSYEDIITAAIKREIDILGEDVALRRARAVDGLTVSDDGTVTGIDRAGKDVLGDLVDTYVEYAGSVSATLIARSISNMDLGGIELPENLAERV